MADYGRMLALWYQIVNYTANTAFEQHTLPRVRAMSIYLYSLYLHSTTVNTPESSLYGLIYGPAGQSLTFFEI